MRRQRKRAAHDADNARTPTTPKGSLAVARRGLAAVHVRACCQIRPQGGTLVKQRYMLSVMCGRSKYKLTREEIVRLYPYIGSRR
jgi:hypothetical protein